MTLQNEDGTVPLVPHPTSLIPPQGDHTQRPLLTEEAPMLAPQKANGPVLVGRGRQPRRAPETVKGLRFTFVGYSQVPREKESKIARRFEPLQEKALFGTLVCLALNEQKGSLFRPPREQPSFQKCSHTFG
ncbi:Hypothetical predicted protein [Marmota monax]|uniref:Uncharacterized protein n=1 Tax=Marmota monax TaxID=9995 RepID=A0A5E4CLZ8_MARMO|nr:Hypothetical predicted protein [Marmota monax]